MLRVISLTLLPVMCILLACNLSLSSTAPTSGILMANDSDTHDDQPETTETIDHAFHTSHVEGENTSSQVSSNVTRLTVNSYSFCAHDDQCTRKVNGSFCDVTIHMCRCPLHHVKNASICE